MHDLWPTQRYAVTAVPQAIADGHRRILLTSPTGGGKTDIIMNVADALIGADKKVAIYTHRRLLIEQMAREFDKFGLDAQVRAPGYDGKYFPLQISSVQTANRRILKAQTEEIHRADLAIFDECFIGETMVATPQGDKRIDLLRAGDPVYCATGIGWIRAVSRRRSRHLYRLEFSDGRECVCTPKHPFFTACGWRAASQLGAREIVFRQEDLSGLWGTVLSETIHQTSNGRSVVGQANLLLHILLKESQKPYVRTGPQGEDACDDPAYWAQAEISRWKRETAACAAIQLAYGSGHWLVPRVRGADERKTSEGRNPNLLQDRHRQSDADDGGRSGRTIAQYPIAESVRREEDGGFNFSRVVRVSRLERRSTMPVFNLNVGGHPSYFASGLLVHNCHVMTGPTCRQLMKDHLNHGASILGVTATPLDLDGLHDHLIVAGTTSELRACGALVPAIHYGPDEPDMKHFAKELAAGKDLSEQKAEKAMMTDGIFGRVLEWYAKLNPEQKPTILFAPSVGASLWFAKQFYLAGISAGHIDGEEVWINGKFVAGNNSRNDLADGSREGFIKVVCNRFVLREGVNWPWLAHGILATVFGSLQSYLQSGGRLLRAHPGLDHVSIQDHGGNWWRHGSLNADRHWELDLTSSSVAALRADEMRQNPAKQPCRCPQCGMILQKSVCSCGFEVHTRTRPVVQSDGTLKEMKGDIFKPRRVAPKTMESIWQTVYFRAKKSRNKMTFFQAEALFAYENNWAWPDRSWRFMPMNPAEMGRKVCSIPGDRLR